MGTDAAIRAQMRARATARKGQACGEGCFSVAHWQTEVHGRNFPDPQGGGSGTRSPDILLIQCLMSHHVLLQHCASSRPADLELG